MGREDKTHEVIKTLSSVEPATELSREKAQDALSIVMDAVDSIISGLIITDLKGIIRFANPSFCRMFDCSSEGIIGENAADLFATREVKNLSDVIALIDLGKEDTEEFLVERQSGEQFIVAVTASNVRSRTGELVGRMASFIDITERKRIESDREKLITKLQDALAKIKTLRGIIPICVSCKKVRDDAGYWRQIESYIYEHSDAELSHGCCPECARKLYPEVYETD